MASRCTRTDLLVIDESSLDLRLLVAEKGLGFEAPRSFLAGLRPAALGLADVIGSSAPDALVARAVSGKLAVLETRPPA